MAETVEFKLRELSARKLKEYIDKSLILLETVDTQGEEVRGTARSLLWSLYNVLIMRKRMKGWQRRVAIRLIERLVVQLEKYSREGGKKPEEVLLSVVLDVAGDLQCVQTVPKKKLQLFSIKTTLLELLKQKSYFNWRVLSCKGKLARYLHRVGLSNDLISKIFELLDSYRAWSLGAPTVIAATTVDYIRWLSPKAVTIKQEELARDFGITSVAIRKRRKDIMKLMQPLSDEIFREIERAPIGRDWVNSTFQGGELLKYV
jgi:hypothetical protein